MYNAGVVPPVDRKYPLEISSWDGIPDEIEAAFMAPNGHTYFFKGGNYWRYDDKSFSVRSHYNSSISILFLRNVKTFLTYFKATENECDTCMNKVSLNYVFIRRHDICTNDV